VLSCAGACHDDAVATAPSQSEVLQMAETQRLVIVQRNQFPKFALLERAFADEPTVRLIWDRRWCEQRRERESSGSEDRRQRERRSDPSKSWSHTDHLLLGVPERVHSRSADTATIATPDARSEDAGVSEAIGLDIGVAVGTVEAFFTSAAPTRTIVHCRRGEIIFSQGDDADGIVYVLKGRVKLSVPGRREVIVGLFGSGDFFGEECLDGHTTRQRQATAITRSTILVVGKASMLRLLRTEPLLTDRFMAHLLSRNARIEEDLIDQHLSSCEQRLARALLILAGYGHPGTRRKIFPRTSQTTLAEIVGSTRPRINQLLRKFKKLGFIEMDGSLTIHRSLLKVVLPSVRRSLRDRATKHQPSSVVRSGLPRSAGDGAIPKTAEHRWAKTAGSSGS
jgi:CRP/FNR family transcriptional regulator, cyclic AMP receptor protein